MTTGHDLDIIQLTRPGDADRAVRWELIACWIAVTNVGGAAGFPFPPVGPDQVTPAVDALAASLDPSDAGYCSPASTAPSQGGWPSAASPAP
jgi:hypothetical protein